MAKRLHFAGIGMISALLFAEAALGDVQPATLEELQNFYPSVSARQNSALVYQAAEDARVTSEFDEDIRVTGGEKELSFRDTKLGTDRKVAIANELARNAKTLELLHEASVMPLCRFPIDLREGQQVLLPHLAPMRDFSRLLKLQAINASDDANSDLAAQSVLDIVAVAQSLRVEPLIISQLARMACWSVAMDALEHVVNRISLPDTCLRQLQESLMKADDRNVITRALQGELCNLMNEETATAEEMAEREKARMLIRENEESREGDLSGSAAEKMDSWPKLDPRIKQEYVQEAKRIVEESRLPYVDFMKPVPQRGDGNNLMGEHFRSFMVAAARNAAKASTAQGAVAIERYRLKTGKLPEKWEGLVPSFLPAPIPDPFVKDGILLFRKTASGYIVYSAGQNGIDDGAKGDVHPQLDIVFTVERPVPTDR